VQAYDFTAGATNYGFTDATKRSSAYWCSDATIGFGVGMFVVAGSITMAAAASALVAATLF
jgi:hypothetical protein